MFPERGGQAPASVGPHSVGQERLLLTRSGSGDPELRSFIGSGPGEGQALALREGAAFFHRSAGACPPRSFVCPRPGEGQALALRGRGRFSTQNPPVTVARGPVPRDRWCTPGLARDRPYAEGGVFRRRTPPGTVARGPVPRDRSCTPGMARDRPSPYVKGRRFFRRSAWDLSPATLRDL